jgi:hypothetical protein
LEQPAYLALSDGGFEDRRLDAEGAELHIQAFALKGKECVRSTRVAADRIKRPYTECERPRGDQSTADQAPCEL